MKNKKIGLKFLFLAAVISASLFTMISKTHAPQDADQDQPVSSDTTKHVTTTPQSNQDDSNATKTSRPNPNPTRTSSRIMQQFPEAPEVRYYLLANVNDPGHSSTWSHQTVQASRAWDLSTGNSDVTVAVIDTGFALSHQDLSDRWHINSDEQGMTTSADICWNGNSEDKQTNNCDDDENGKIDDWRGYDFYYDDNDPSAGTVNANGEGTQHGSMVAGVIGASANNNLGSTGIDHNAQIMPLQVFSDDGDAFTSDIVSAIEYAADNGADIINLSLGSNGYDAPMLAAVRYAKTNGVLVVAASGNCALNDEVFCNSLAAPGRMTYPALYDEPVAVGATTSSDVRASYSSYGPKLDMVAPGSSITPLPIYTAANQTSAYATASGTSFAAPLVAGTASLLLAQNPTLSPSQLEFMLTEGIDRPSAMGSNIFTNEYGYGRLNAHKSTLLALASTDLSQLGEESISRRQPAIGAIWRSHDGQLEDDESVLVGCRVAISVLCSATIEGTSTSRLIPSRAEKGDEIHYIFARGSHFSSGDNIISVHSSDNATEITILTK